MHAEFIESGKGKKKDSCLHMEFDSDKEKLKCTKMLKDVPITLSDILYQIEGQTKRKEEISYESAIFGAATLNVLTKALENEEVFIDGTEIQNIKKTNRNDGKVLLAKRTVSKKVSRPKSAGKSRKN